MAQMARWQKDLVLSAFVSGFAILLLLWPFLENPDVLRQNKYRVVLMVFSTLAMPILDWLFTTMRLESSGAFMAAGAAVTFVVNTLALFLVTTAFRLVTHQILNRLPQRTSPQK